MKKIFKIELIELIENDVINNLPVVDKAKDFVRKNIDLSKFKISLKIL